MTKEVIDTLTHDGAVNPDALDKALHDFDLDFSLKKKMAQKHVDAGKEGLGAAQLAQVMRKTSSFKELHRCR
jgi:hypothetical protein